MQERRHISHQNPDHPADAEVGWKCDEFSVVAAFMLLVRLSHDGRWLKVATGPPVCGCAIRLLQKITLLDAIVLNYVLHWQK